MQLPGDLLGEQVVRREQVLEDVERVRGVGDPFGASEPSRSQFA